MALPERHSRHFPTGEDGHEWPVGRRHWIWPSLGLQGRHSHGKGLQMGVGRAAAPSQLGGTGGRSRPQGTSGTQLPPRGGRAAGTALAFLTKITLRKRRALRRAPAALCKRHPGISRTLVPTGVTAVLGLSSERGDASTRAFWGAKGHRDEPSSSHPAYNVPLLREQNPLQPPHPSIKGTCIHFPWHMVAIYHDTRNNISF